jgi:hypothetical protein
MNDFDYKIYTIRDSAILTGSYVAGTVIGDPNIIYEKNQLVLLVDFEIGDLTSAEIKIEFSYDGTNYYQETIDQVDYSTGTITEILAVRQLTGDASLVIPLPIKYRFLKVSSKGTGTVDNSLLSIIAVVGNV